MELKVQARLNLTSLALYSLSWFLVALHLQFQIMNSRVVDFPFTYNPLFYDIAL